MQINNFQSDPTDVSANTKSLLVTILQYNHTIHGCMDISSSEPGCTGRKLQEQKNIYHFDPSKQVVCAQHDNSCKILLEVSA